MEKKIEMTKSYYRMCNEKSIMFLMMHGYLGYLYNINFTEKNFFNC